MCTLFSPPTTAVYDRFVFSGLKIVIDGGGVQALVHQLPDSNGGIAIFFKAVIAAITETMFSRCRGQNFPRNASVNHDPAVTGGADTVHTGTELIVVLNLAPGGIVLFLNKTFQIIAVI